MMRHTHPARYFGPASKVNALVLPHIRPLLLTESRQKTMRHLPLEILIMQTRSGSSPKLLIGAGVLLVALAVSISLSYDSIMSAIPGTHQSRRSMGLTTFARTRSISLAMFAYADAHQHHLPKTAHWEEDIGPYIQKDKFGLITLPAPPGSAPRRIAMNAALSGADLDKLPNRSNTILLFETISTQKDAIGDPDKTPSLELNGGYEWETSYADGRSGG